MTLGKAYTHLLQPQLCIKQHNRRGSLALHSSQSTRNTVNYKRWRRQREKYATLPEEVINNKEIWRVMIALHSEGEQLLFISVFSLFFSVFFCRTVFYSVIFFLYIFNFCLVFLFQFFFFFLTLIICASNTVNNSAYLLSHSNKVNFFYARPVRSISGKAKLESKMRLLYGRGGGKQNQIIRIHTIGSPQT